MEISKKKLLAVIFLFSILTFTVGYAFQNNFLFSKHQPMGSVANVFFTVESPMGTYDLLAGNLITDIGESQVCTRGRAGATYVAISYVSLSNDATPLAAWTQLPNEAATLGATRALGTISAEWAYSGDSAYNVTKKFTFTGDITLQCAGGNWASSGDNNLYSAAAFTQTAFANNWNLTITWVYVFNGN